MSADISVLIPARNEGTRLTDTIVAIAQARATDARLEFVIADDQSDEDIRQTLRAAAQPLRRQARIDIKVSRLRQRQGVPRARNHAAALATGEILFITDAHVQVSYGFDALILENVKPKRIIAGAITEANTPFIGYGCKLVVPFM